MERYDVVVVGGGAAGSGAAVAASRAGARTLVIRRGPGVTAMAAGAWLGQPPAPLVEGLESAGLPLVPCAGALPHPEGLLLGCELAPRSHVRAALPAGEQAQALVCGIAGLPSFRARALARLWSDAAGPSAPALEPVTLLLADTPPAGWSAIALAAALEQDPQRLGAPLARAVRERGAARAIVPAVLGLDAHLDVHASLEEVTGVAVGEALGVAPSVPGWRLDRALQRTLAAAGVDVVTGAVLGAEHVSAQMAVLEVSTAAGRTRIRCGALVLAAGKFAGGGLTADPVLAETVFGGSVVVAAGGRRFMAATESLALTSPLFDDPQPLLAAGVNSGGPWPTQVQGTATVFVAGSLRGGVETARTGLGTVAAEGWEVGLLAAAAAGRSGSVPGGTRGQAGGAAWE